MSNEQKIETIDDLVEYVQKQADSRPVAYSKRYAYIDILEKLKKIKENLNSKTYITDEIKAAQVLGRLGGLKGGKARAEKLTPEIRAAIAKKAADTRWLKFKNTETQNANA